MKNLQGFPNTCLSHCPTLPNVALFKYDLRVIYLITVNFKDV